MTKADWLALAGYVFVDIGLGVIYWPLAFIFAGVVCLRLAGFAIRPPTEGANE